MNDFASLSGCTYGGAGGEENFTRVFVLEIQTHPGYNVSAAYRLFGQLTEIPRQILDQGRQELTFRPEADRDIFGHFILGAVNYLFFTTFMFERPFRTLDEFDDLAGLFVAAVVRGRDQDPTVAPDQADKRERILIAAERLFSDKNFYEAKITEIARRAGVADGTIYEYFANKEELLFSLFEKRMDDFARTFEETMSPQDPKQKLKHVLWHFLTWAEMNRPWVRIFFNDLIPNPNFYQSPPPPGHAPL